MPTSEASFEKSSYTINRIALKAARNKRSKNTCKMAPQVIISNVGYNYIAAASWPQRDGGWRGKRTLVLPKHIPPPPRTGALTGDNLIPCLPMRTTRAVPTKLKCRCSCSSLHTQPQEIFIQAYKTKTRDHRKIEPKTVSLCVIFGSFKDPFFFFVNRAPRTANWVFFA